MACSIRGKKVIQISPFFFRDEKKMEEAKREVGWGDAAFWSSIAIAVIIVAVGITFFVILILTSMRQVDVYFEAYAVPNAVKAAAPAC